jgi:hypothetical protein
MLAPEPTTLTKLAGGALGAHGLDTSAAAMRQIANGTDARTFTADAAKAASAALGLEAATAEMIGLSADLAIPLLAGGIGALRVIAVRRGSLSLAAEEARRPHHLVGEGVVRATGKLQQMTRLVVVLRRVQQQNRVFFILTAYPRP